MIFHCKTLQNFPKIWIFGLKTNHLATLLTSKKPDHRQEKPGIVHWPDTPCGLASANTHLGVGGQGDQMSL
jgi:hypothetical protein